MPSLQLTGQEVYRINRYIYGTINPKDRRTICSNLLFEAEGNCITVSATDNVHLSQLKLHRKETVEPCLLLMRPILFKDLVRARKKDISAKSVDTTFTFGPSVGDDNQKALEAQGFYRSLTTKNPNYGGRYQSKKTVLETLRRLTDENINLAATMPNCETVWVERKLLIKLLVKTDGAKYVTFNTTGDRSPVRINGEGMFHLLMPLNPRFLKK